MKATKSYLLKLSLLVCMLFGLMTVSVNAATLYTTPDGLYSFTLSNNKAIIHSYNGIASKITIPNKLQAKSDGTKYSVAYIGNGKNSILKSSDGVKEVILPTNATKISANAFLNAKVLKKVTVGSKLRTIADNAFQGCKKLTSIDLSAATALKTIGDEVFVDCAALTSFTCGPAVETIGDGAFLGCTKLEHVTFSAVLTSIGEEAFRKCAALTSLSTLESVPSYNRVVRHLPFDGIIPVYFPESLKEIGATAFYGTGLTGLLFIPSGITNIQENTFQSCKNLVAIYLTTGIETIGYNAFRGCTSVEHLFLPTTLTEIDETAFSGNTINNDHTSLYLFKKSYVDSFLNGTKQYYSGIFNYLDPESHTFKHLVEAHGYTMDDTLYASKTTFWAGQTIDLKILFNMPLNIELSDNIIWETNRPSSILFVKKNQDSAIITSTTSGSGYMVKAIVDEDHDASVNLTVKPAPTKVTINKLNADPAAKYKVNLKKKNSIQLVAKTAPADGADVTWSSSNTSIAKVNSDGLVTSTGNEPGKVTITAKTYNGKTKTCEIEFYYNIEDCNNKYLIDPKKDINIVAGTSKVITKPTLPAGMVFTSSNPSIATIDSKGKVTARSAGVTKITGYYIGDPSSSYIQRVETLIYVVPKAQKIKLTQQSNGVKIKWKKDTTCDGYEIRYGKSTSNYSKVKASLPPAKYAYLLKALPSGKKSIVQVAAYITYKGKKHYGSFAKASIVAK